MKIKVKYILTFCLFMIFSISIVNASEIVNESENVYINSNNVEIENSLYQKLCDIYSKNYIEYISQENFDSIKNNDLSDIQIIEHIDDFPLITRSGTFTTTYKSLKIIKNGSHISLMLSWLKLPATRSYDVFGIRFDQVKLNGGVSFMQTYLENNVLKMSTSNHYQSFSNGFGVSFLLPSQKIDSLESYIEFNITGSGKIYGTYQHAQRSVSLSDSMNYTISSSGYGNVLKFASNVSEKYDAMSGVSLTI